MKPMEIEKQSFAIIEKELTTQIPPQYKPVVKRVIHTTADFSYETNMVFSEGVVDKALEAIQKGTDIVTDTNMAGAGISHKMAERFGISLHCYMADEAVAKEAAAREITRAAVSVEKAAKQNPGCIMVVGNAPTALMKIRELSDKGIFTPSLVIGVPVGFVNVVEAKEEIIDSTLPYIVAKGRKGGSNVAAAIVNALFYMAAQMLERYVYKNQKKMRCGYTTGTCAAAAAKAAAQMLLSGRKVTEVSVRTPSDITLTLPVCEIQMKAHAVSCAVQKDSGDDPDITNKILIFAEVSYIHNNSNMNKSTDMTVKKCDTESERSDTAAVKPQMIVDGGVGIGRITKKGLALSVHCPVIHRAYRLDVGGYGVPTAVPLPEVVFESLQYGRAQLAHGHRLPFGECRECIHR